MKLSVLILSAILMISGCNVPGSDVTAYREISENATEIVLSDEIITVNGAEISEDESAPVYWAKDIVYYPEGKDFTFGEGEEKDEHTEEEAIAHTVVHISKPGDYIISGKLSQGQIAVDLGEDAEDDPNAVVTLMLKGADITCTVAPAVIFYNVYECGEKNEENAKMDVDTQKAGANIIIADGTENNINGSYVARIYESVELSEDGKEVVDSKKLHKYDGAFYSKMSMNIYGEKTGDGVLNITAENEGLGTELHLTIFSGNINIESGNDGINTNEDNVSVTAINGGNLNIAVTGETGEGDGIDSNGWLVINGGQVTASACGTSGDSGIDADKGVYINGGTVLASGNMLDRMQGEQGYTVFSFSERQEGGNTYTIKNEKGETVVSYAPQNAFTNMIVSASELTPGEYTIWQADNRLKAASGGMSRGGMPMGQPPEGTPENAAGERPQRPQGGEMPEGQEMPQRPEGDENFDGKRGPMGEMPDGQEPPQMPEGGQQLGEMRPEGGVSNGGMQGERAEIEYSDTFTVKEGTNQFMVSRGE